MYSVLSASFLFYLFMLSPFLPIRVSVSALGDNPECWIGRRVTVRGRLSFGFCSIPEQRLPFNYLLRDLCAGKSVGVLLDEGSYSLDGRNVTVVGVVKKGYTGPLIVRPMYYIAAEKARMTD